MQAAKSASISYDGLEMLRWNLANNARGTVEPLPPPSSASQTVPVAQTDSNIVQERKASEPPLSSEDMDAEKLYSKVL